jgi:hypothetical protein
LQRLCDNFSKKTSSGRRVDGPHLFDQRMATGLRDRKHVSTWNKRNQQATTVRSVYDPKRAEPWPAGAGNRIIRANARDANAERYD